MQAASPAMLPYEALRWVFMRVALGVVLAVIGFSIVARVQAEPGESFVASVLGLSALSEQDEAALPMLDTTVFVPFVTVDASDARSHPRPRSATWS